MFALTLSNLSGVRARHLPFISTALTHDCVRSQAFDNRSVCVSHSHSVAAVCNAKKKNFEAEKNEKKKNRNNNKIKAIGKHKSVIRQM